MSDFYLCEHKQECCAICVDGAKQFALKLESENKRLREGAIRCDYEREHLAMAKDLTRFREALEKIRSHDANLSHGEAWSQGFKLIRIAKEALESGE